MSDSSTSLLALIGSFVAPVFTPLGLNDWRISTSLFTGFIAKENVVSSLTILLAGESLSALFSNLSAITFLTFCLLYTPCVAAISAVKRELGGKMAIIVVIMQCVVAYLVALLVHTAGLLFV